MIRTLFLVLILLITQRNYAEIIWSPPIDLSEEGQPANNPKIATDNLGNAVVIWQKQLANIQALMLPFGGIWSEPIDVSELEEKEDKDNDKDKSKDKERVEKPEKDFIVIWRNFGTGISRPFGSRLPIPVEEISEEKVPADVAQVATDSHGNAIAIWRKLGTHNTIQVARKSFKGNWSSPIDLSNPEHDSDCPQLAVDSNGNAVAIWEESNGQSQTIQAARCYANGNWSTSLPISQSKKIASNPQLALDNAGNAIAIWEAFDGSCYLIETATLPFKGMWTATTSLYVGSQDASHPKLALDKKGNAMATWEVSVKGHQMIEAATYFHQGNWSTPVALPLAGENAKDPQIAMDSKGNATAVWEEFDGENHVIRSANCPFNGNWSDPVTLSTAGQDAKDPQITIDGMGNAIAVWEGSEKENRIIQTVNRPSQGKWSTPVALSAAGKDSTSPQLTVDSAGNAVVVWLSQTNRIIQASTGLVHPQITQINATQIIDCYAFQEDLVNTLSWICEGKVASFQIYRDKNLTDFVTKVDKPIFTDHNRPFNLPSTYFIVAEGVDGFKNVSTQITIE